LAVPLRAPSASLAEASDSEPPLVDDADADDAELDAEEETEPLSSLSLPDASLLPLPASL
jgi:hypothetical protein